MSSGIQPSVRSESRVISPYSTPVDRTTLLKQTNAEIYGRVHGDGEFVVVDSISASDYLTLNIKIDSGPLEKLLSGWNLEVSDLSIVVIYEEKMLWDLELLEIPVSKMKEVASAKTLEVVVPQAMLEVAQTDRLIVRVYLVLGRNLNKPVQDSPSNRGAIISSWSLTLGGPEEQQWWDIKLLNDETLEILNRNRRIPVYKKAFVFVETEDLLVPGDLSERVSVYLNEDIAAQLQTSRAQTVVDAVFNFVGSEVIASILAGLRHELAQMSDSIELDEEAAIMPFLNKVGETLEIEVDEVIALVRRDGEDLTALKSNLQRIVPLTDSIKKMLKGLTT